MMRNLGCLASQFSAEFNFGFMDHRLSEKVFETYDMALDFGRATPALIVFANGRAYPARTGTLGPAKLVNFLNNFADEAYCQFCGQVI